MKTTLKILLALTVMGLVFCGVLEGLRYASAHPLMSYSEPMRPRHYQEPEALKVLHVRYDRQSNAGAPFMDRCVTASLATEVALQANDSMYESWLRIRGNDCRRAGL